MGKNACDGVFRFLEHLSDLDSQATSEHPGLFSFDQFSYVPSFLLIMYNLLPIAFPFS